MTYIQQLIQSFKSDERGQALTEYGLIIALVAVVLIAALGLLSGALENTFDAITNRLNNPNP